MKVLRCHAQLRYVHCDCFQTVSQSARQLVSQPNQSVRSSTRQQSMPKNSQKRSPSWGIADAVPRHSVGAHSLIRTAVIMHCNIICMFIRLTVCLSTCLSTCMSTSLSVCLNVCLPVCLSVLSQPVHLQAQSARRQLATTPVCRQRYSSKHRAPTKWK